MRMSSQHFLPQTIQILIQISIKVSFLIISSLYIKIYIEKNYDYFVTTSILPNYKSKNFEIVNKLNKQNFNYSSNDFIEFYHKKTSKQVNLTMRTENMISIENDNNNVHDNDSLNLRMKEKSLQNIDDLLKKKYFSTLKSLNISEEALKLSNHIETFNIQMGCNILTSFNKHKTMRRVEYYLMKWKYSNIIGDFSRKFDLNLKEKEKIHENVCEKYKDLMNFERENFRKLSQLKFGMNGTDIKVSENSKTTSKNEVLNLFHNYYEQIEENIKGNQTDQKRDVSKNKIRVKEINKLLLYNLVIDLIDKFKN